MARTLVTTALSSRLDSLPVVAANTADGIQLSIGGAAVTSSALTGAVYYFCPSTSCYVAIGLAPTATTGAANLPFYGAAMIPLLVPDGHKVSVIGMGGSTGTLQLVPVTEG
jgi:hypothetical protein